MFFEVLNAGDSLKLLKTLGGDTALSHGAGLDAQMNLGGDVDPASFVRTMVNVLGMTVLFKGNIGRNSPLLANFVDPLLVIEFADLGGPTFMG